MYRVQLQQFEGPMDLLLFFIKRDEIDIYDIPIAQIADEYLAYVRVMEEIYLDGVGDFIYMAALLINIKAQMLLPSDEADEDGDAVDPRRELVERLLEYVRFREAADQLDTRREQRTSRFTRGDAADQQEAVEERFEADIDSSVYDLVTALGKMLEVDDEADTEPVHEVEPLEHSVDEQQTYVMQRIMTERRVSFRTLVQDRTKGFVIATFLAVLELARQRHIHIALSDSPSDFAVEKPEAGHSGDGRAAGVPPDPSPSAPESET
jgi:segregation and condensation protein A